MVSGLLDALDNSIFLDAAGDAPVRAPEPSRIAESLKQARMTQLNDYMSAPSQSSNNVEFLSQRIPKGHAKLSVDGFSVNYDKDTLVKAIDIGGPDQQKQIADFVSSGIENTDIKYTVAKALKRLKLKDRQSRLPGLEVCLLPHQVVGVAWMLDQEMGKNKGGILADDMGLGKTIQMIATMSANAADLNSDCRATLIVVPAALLEQWKEEIETRTNGAMSAHVHHGKDKLKKVAQIEKYDAIITTYQTLTNDFFVPKDVDESETAEYLRKEGGILARAKFYRAIADEAQFIRNRGTRASSALAQVHANYRWMLTGTPITNSLADIYGLLRFGRFRPWNDWNDFNSHVAKMQNEDAILAGQRAQVILKPLLLRRTKNSKLEGKPILELKPKDIELATIQFSDDERKIYDDFEKRTKIRVNKFIREHTLIKNHAAVLVMILRLRQLCGHPQLILSQTEDYADPTLIVGSEGDKEFGRALKMMGKAWTDKVKAQALKIAGLNRMDFPDETVELQDTCPNCREIYENDNARVLSCQHKVCFNCLLEIRNSEINHDGIFGQGSEKENIANEKAFEEANTKGYRRCPTCQILQDFTNKSFLASAFAPSDEEIRAASYKATRSLNKRSRGDLSDSGDESIVAKTKSFDERGMDDSDDDMPDIGQLVKSPSPKRRKTGKHQRIDGNDSEIDSSDLEFSISRGKREKAGETPLAGISDAVITTWRRGDDDVEPSAKMNKMIELLKEWNSTGDKTIVYSQWTSMLDLVEKIFVREGIRSLRFDGSMRKAERDATLSGFKSLGGPKVLLISTRCGGVGLNLVVANRIINMDLSWNYASESQAYDRVHRIGQDKDVFVKRVVVENTIEERMLKLQDVKVGLAEAALGEGTGTRLTKMSVKDIKYLFGMTPPEKPK